MLSERPEPSEVEDEKRKFVEILSSYRDDYSDEVPDESVASIAENKHFKVRKAWWSAVIVRLDLLERNGLLNDELRQKSVDFRDEYTSSDFKQRKTTTEDIAAANQLIDEIISYLQSG